MRKRNLIETRKNILGNVYVYRFENSFGASVVDMKGSDEYEIGVLEFYSKEHNDHNVTYDTPITDDVLILHDEKQVDFILNEIELLGKENSYKLC